MENKDFDRLFKKGLEGLPEEEFPFKEEAWDQVHDTLDRKKILPPIMNGGGTGFRWRKHLIWVLLLLLISGNIFMGWKFSTSQQEITLLESTISTLTEEVENYRFIVDNTSITQTTTDSSTVQNDLNFSSIASNLALNPNYTTASTPSSSTFPALQKSALNRPSLTLDKPLIGGFVKPNLSFSNTNSATNTTPNVALNLNQSPTLIGQVDTISSMDNISLNDKDTKQVITSVDGRSTVNTDIRDTDNRSNPKQSPVETLDKVQKITNIQYLVTNIKKLKQQPFILAKSLDSLVKAEDYNSRTSYTDLVQRLAYATQPTAYEVGISGNINYISAPNRFSQWNNGGGLLGEVTLGKGTKLGVSGRYMLGKFEIEDIAASNLNEELFASFPDLVPAAPDDALNKVEASYKTIEIPLYVKFLLRPNYSFTPYIGIGLVGQYHLEQKFEYYFLQAPDYLVEYERKGIFGNYSQLEFNTFSTMFGVEYRKFEKFNIRLGGTYNRDFRPTGLEQRQYSGWGGELSILYNLK